MPQPGDISCTTPTSDSIEQSYLTQQVEISLSRKSCLPDVIVHGLRPHRCSKAKKASCASDMEPCMQIPASFRESRRIEGKPHSFGRAKAVHGIKMQNKCDNFSLAVLDCSWASDASGLTCAPLGRRIVPRRYSISALVHAASPGSVRSRH